MILLSELSRRRIRSIQKLIRVGRNEVVVVLRVDKEKGVCVVSLTYCLSSASRSHFIEIASLPRERCDFMIFCPSWRISTSFLSLSLSHLVVLLYVALIIILTPHSPIA